MGKINSGCTFDVKGMPVYVASTTPTRDQERVHIPVFPTKAIPVVFLPGIMGSPLRSLGNGHLITVMENNPWAWFPDSGAKWVAGFGKGRGYADLEPQQRKELLNPNATQALGPYDQDINEDIRKDINKALRRSFDYNGFKANKLMNLQEALRRGWGTVMWGTYGKVLVDLEHRLRYLTYTGSAEREGFIMPQPIRESLLEVRSNFPQVLQEDFSDIVNDKQYHRTPFWDSLKPYLEHAANYCYPVFAVGYNWLQSNNDSAIHAYERINEILDYVRAPRAVTPRIADDRNSLDAPLRSDNGLGLECDEVIIVTHSMGGLVCRALANNHPDLKIRGVVHGVQPINGAATLYSRLLTGWEGFAGRYLGKTGAELVPVLGNAPGGMELAPNQHYGAGWLRIRNMSHVESIDDPNSRIRIRNPDILTLPNLQADGLCNPYEDIYLERDAWWKLADPALIDPLARTPEDLDDAWDKYSKVVEKAQNFHAKLDTYFHPRTYIFYGNSAAHRTWGSCTWELYHYRSVNRYNRIDVRGPVSAADVNRAQAEAFPERGGNTILSLSSKEVYPYEYFQVRFKSAEDDGDGTVPFNSGYPWKTPTAEDTNQLLKRDTAPRGIRFVYELRRSASEHSKAYDAKNARDVTLFSIMNLIGKQA